jgi:hypothetical protein
MTGCIELPTRPKAARNAVASRGHVAHRDRAPVVASVKMPSPTKTPKGPVTPPASVVPASPASVSPEDDASPRVLSAVLLSPFDDVDGPPASTDSPDHREIR